MSLHVEKSGSCIPNAPTPNKFDLPEDRYALLKDIPERYSIIKVGIALFHENPGFKRYMKRRVERRLINNINIEDPMEDDDQHHDGHPDPPVIHAAGENDDDGDVNAMPRMEYSNWDEDDFLSSDESSENESISSHHDNTIDDDDSRLEGEHQVLGQVVVPGIPIIPGNIEHLNLHLPILPIQDDNRLMIQRNIDLIHGDVVENQDDHDHDREEDEESPEFFVRKYNFYIFPSNQQSSREIVLNPSNIHLMNEHEMGFNEWLRHGIPFTTIDEAESITNDLSNGHQEEIFETDCTKWEEPTDPHDVAFIARTMASIREWIDSAAPSATRRLSDNLSIGDEERLGIARVIHLPKKEAIRACLRGKINYEYPSLFWEKHNNQHILVRLNDTEKKLRDERKKHVTWKQAHINTIGFTRVFKALSDSCRGELGQIGDLDTEYMAFSHIKELGKINFFSRQNGSPFRRVPIVVHDGLMDFLFLLTHFHSPKLPESYEEAKSLIHQYFPIVYDTNTLATEICGFHFLRRNLSLLELYQRFVLDNLILIDDETPHHGGNLPQLRIVNAHELSEFHPQDDGNDGALRIGALFQCLSRRLMIMSSDHGREAYDIVTHLYSKVLEAKRSKVGSMMFLDEKHPKNKLSEAIFKMNRVYLDKSIFTVDLSAALDPLKICYSSSSIFRVSHPSRNIRKNEVQQVIDRMRDPESRDNVGYEVCCISKRIYVAETVPKNANTIILDKRSNILRSNLQSDFPDSDIISLEDVLSGIVSEPWAKSTLNPYSIFHKSTTSNRSNSNVLSRFLGSFLPQTSKIGARRLDGSDSKRQKV